MATVCDKWCKCGRCYTQHTYQPGSMVMITGLLNPNVRFLNGCRARVEETPNCTRSSYIITVLDGRRTGRRHWLSEKYMEPMPKKDCTNSPECHTAQLLAWFNKHKPVMEAYLKGEAIECSTREATRWYSCDIPRWSFDSEYRIKPEPVCVLLYWDEDPYLPKPKWRPWDTGTETQLKRKWHSGERPRSIHNREPKYKIVPIPED